MSHDETEIRELWNCGQRKDLAGMLRHEAPAMLMCDVPGTIQFKGIKRYQRTAAALLGATLCFGCDSPDRVRNAGATGVNNSAVTHRRVSTNGIHLHIAEAGSGLPVIFLHGFPELWYSWRYQLPALAEAGYHAIAPDLRGYGESDAPSGIEHYTIRKIVGDVVGLLDTLGAEEGVVVGLDWGARIAWTAAQMHPKRVVAVVALGVPFYPRADEPPSEAFDPSGKFSIIEYFQKPGVAEAELEQDVRRSMTYFLATLYGGSPPELLRKLYLEKPAGSRLLDGMPAQQPLPAWLSKDDLDHYVQEFERTGFGNALNLYRNLDRDWRESEALDRVKVQQPALFMAGDRDPAFMFGSLDPMKSHVPNLRKIVLLPDAGHLIQLEHPRTVNAELIGFLRREIRR